MTRASSATIAGRLAGWLGVVVGVLHECVACLQYRSLSFDALWFVGSGLAVMLIGALTLLSHERSPTRALRGVALAANVAGACLGVAFGVLTRWGAPQGPVLALLFAVGAASLVSGEREP